MRLIDADKLLSKLNKAYAEVDAEYQEAEFDSFYDSFYGGECSAIQEIIKEVEKQPAVQDMPSENVKAAVAEEIEDAEQPHDAPEQPKSKRKSRLDKDKVLQMLKDGYSVQEIAREYGYKTTNAVDNFCKENKIKIQLYVQNSSRQLTAEDIPQIKALYTDGPFNLTETAAELNVSKKQLRAFVEENHIVKPVKD